MPQPKVSIIIVSWNSARYLPSCLKNLSVQTFKNFEIIIVDNGSKDNCAKGLEDIYPNLDLKVKHLPSNLGFATANNIGARLAKGHWLALLNADAFPEPDWLDKLLQAVKNYPQFSCFSSRQIQANNPNFLDGAGDAYHVSGMAWRIGIGYPSEQYGRKFEEIFSPCAAAAMYSREAFLEVGGFDEDYFSYFEDVDLGFRLQLKENRCLYVPSATVCHVGSATFGERSDFAFYHAHRNLIWTFVKNMPSALLWRYLPSHIVANLIYIVYYMFRGRGKILWKAKKDAIRGLSKAIQKRRKIQAQRKITDRELLKVMKRGWLQPYLLGYRLRRILNAKSQKA
ncbi:MAG: glycosyltransferase family 2 protein [Marinirhabdus sp.]|nr:glycosyltransferase family 2 protein [Marinirhabdus sp.]